MFRHFTNYISKNMECVCTCCDNKIRELIAVKVLHASFLNIIVVPFKRNGVCG